MQDELKDKEDRLSYRDRILTELYHSGRLQHQVKLICFKNHIHHHTNIHEDIFQLTMEILSSKSPEEIIEAYENDNGRPERLDRLVAFGVTLAIRKGVYRGYTQNPKTSLVNEILHTSSLHGHNMSIYKWDDWDEIEIFEEEKNDKELTEEQLDDIIKAELTEEEYEFMNFLKDDKKGKGRYKKEIYERRELLYRRIKEIILKHKQGLNG